MAEYQKASLLEPHADFGKRQIIRNTQGLRDHARELLQGRWAGIGSRHGQSVSVARSFPDAGELYVGHNVSAHESNLAIGVLDRAFGFASISARPIDPAPIDLYGYSRAKWSRASQDITADRRVLRKFRKSRSTTLDRERFPATQLS